MCPHDDADRCSCRKPAPGLLLDAARQWGLDLPASVMVGDRWRDVEAGKRAGCRTVFVDHGYDEPRPQGADLTVKSLPEAVPIAAASIYVIGVGVYPSRSGSAFVAAEPWAGCVTLSTVSGSPLGSESTAATVAVLQSGMSGSTSFASCISDSCQPR